MLKKLHDNELHSLCFSLLIKDDKMYRACEKWGETKNAALFYVENLNETNDLGDLGICKKIILKHTLKN